jgi:hypothetical protein
VELSVYEMEIHQLEQRTSAATFRNTCSKAVGLVPEALDSGRPSVKAAMPWKSGANLLLLGLTTAST